ncbi:hypothetical protein [Bosea sp. 685]|uniref:hypothetical protein n=1 Tax=Bosea sp. 685 TaxID=3080057 RepID=UPI002892F95A|nr:hypothetical protein [Bosea sp. 685]WNJ88386.1 hypothetical protein RMR04_18425 [Bosea sp. 685]
MLVRLGVVLALMLPTPSPAEEGSVGDLNKAIERIKQEAAVVVQTVIRDHVPDQARCIFTTEWSNRTVDVTLARQYLGSNLLADAVSPHTATRPSDFIDPTGKMPDHFCSNAEADALWKQRLTAFQSSDKVTAVEKDQPRISHLRVEVAMPVFDAKFETAVVVVSFLRQAASKLRMSMPDGAGYSLVYQKQSSDWVQIHETQDYTVN